MRINEANYEHACTVFDLIGERGEIFAELGTSPAGLEASLPDLAGARVLFYLDAHWGSYWPLLDELAVIAKHEGPAPVIVIHDFRVPDRADLGFDSYEGQQLDFDYVRGALDPVYRGGYCYHYNRLATGARRGVISVEPKGAGYAEWA